MTPRSLAQNPGGVYSMPQGMDLMTPRSLAQNPGGVYSMPQGTDLMTRRSLAQNLGGGYSMPQGMDLMFLVKGACLPIWMASAPHEVECKGSTMYYTPNILVQLGEHDDRVSVSCQERVTSQSNLLTPDTKECDSLPLVRQHTCRLGF